MKKILVYILICITTAYADEIYLKNGNIIKGSIKSISSSNIKYSVNKAGTGNIPIRDVSKIVYKDGTEVKIQEKEIIPAGDITAAEESTASEEGTVPEGKRKFARIVWNTEVEPVYIPLLLRMAFQMDKGNTTVKIFDRDKDEIADGEADFNQYEFKISYESVESEFYISPELGCFYRQIKVKDYSYSVEKENTDVEGFIPGIVTDTDTGEVISKDSVSSLNYNATFHSFFLDLKTGYTFVSGFGPVNLIVNPYISVNLVELRKSVFEFSFYNSNEKYSRPYKFSFLNSWGTGLELGMFFPGLRFGVKAGYDVRMFRKFQIGDGVVFKEVYEDESGLKRTRENSAKYTEIQADLFTLNVFFYI